ncbi:monovalent cation/H+ antiporter complex subunit F [Streptomyces sp. NRRL F-5135]|uniref:monovalent cation/H+ antiporter complex subunit F n=1 Tax=Streptomyces sp. NRRL F-5135 TaxID=1463858 RepID=UPI0006892F2A|nr:monovalent cation/H+ antiporter complex subunit F [Streptomyces sp. NRRL F-5135]
MNTWLTATAALLTLGLGPCLWVAARGPGHRRLPGANLATTLVAVVFLLLAQGFGRSSYTDMALALAVLGPTGTLVFTRFLGAGPEPASEPEPEPDRPRREDGAAR